MQNVKAEKAEVELAGDLDVKKVHARELTRLCSCMFLIFCAGGSDDVSGAIPPKKKKICVSLLHYTTLALGNYSIIYIVCTTVRVELCSASATYSTTNDHKF